jgi:serine phosphatase RsbU (regulator of sigma subunit)
MNLYIKLSLLGLTLVLFTTGTLFYFSNKAAKATLKQQILEDFGQRASLKMASIDRFVQQRKSDIQMAALNPVLRSRTRFTTEELNALLKDMEKVNKLYYSYSFFDTNRIRLADSKGLSVGEQHSYSRYWKQIDFNHPNGNFEIDFSLSESIGQIVVHCASIVYDYNNRPTGVLVSRVLVDRLYEVFIDKDKGFQKYKARLELIDKDGTYLYSSEGGKNFFGGTYNDLRIDSILGTKIFAKFETERRLFMLVREIGYLNYKGRDWVLVYSLPVERAFQAIEVIQRNLILVLFGVIFIAILITLTSARYLTRPIQNLTIAAREMAEGNLDVSFIVRTKDEIQTLGVQLQKMSRTLKHRLEEQTLLSNELTHKNNQITDSIKYAERIQNSILPVPELFDKLLPDYFVLYQPKDIVSGDFFYLSEQSGKIFLAVADCTGHGVPGAFMSLLGYNGLVNLIEVLGLTNPNQILRELNRLLFKMFENERMESLVGMEIGLCVIDKQAKTIDFAGAGMDLFLFENNELIVFPKNFRSIGTLNEMKNKLPEVQPVSYKEGAMLYLSTDGFKDQIGGPNQKKFMKKRFLKLLNDIHSLDIFYQKKDLETTMQDWRRGEMQLDDILVLGVRL